MYLSEKYIIINRFHDLGITIQAIQQKSSLFIVCIRKFWKRMRAKSK